ncbi:MAG: hypothetical protein G01um101429_65 [Parcubacteria group bacterium Gr01-1014_29]|nr:MAG: hypothetical protein G01um101429_65 [Parcubacteria group bacterium Gr01-1014_29]
MTTVKIAAHMPLLYTPKFWAPAKAYENYTPDIEGAKLEGAEYARKHGLEPAFRLLERPEGASMAFLTDLQQDFRDHGRLPVTGTDDVVLRCASRLINGFISGHYAGLKRSKDGHPPVHVSFGTYFRTQTGELFDLRTRKASILALEDDKKCIFKATCFDPSDGSPVDAGYIQPMYKPHECVAYNHYLESTGQAPQWAFAQHCELGTDGESFHPLIVEAVAFASGLRSFVPGLVSKGHIMEWDWYGPLCSCGGYSEDPNIVPVITHPQGGFQKDIVDGFKPFRSVEFFGVAEDFCDYWMKKQSRWYFRGTEFLKKMVFVEDGTAPIVPNAQHVKTQNAEARAEGVKFIKHDTPFAQSL